MKNNIPLVNLKRQYLSIKTEIKHSLEKVFSEGDFVLGKEVVAFEEEFAKYTGAKFCVGVGSGRDALLLSMRALGIGTGDEVITVPNTFIATVFPIIELGVKPVFVDINPKTYQIDVENIEKAITKKTKAIIPVHIFGMPCQMDEIVKIANKHKLIVIEDAAQAHGSYLEGRHLGTFGEVGAFSYYAGKNLGAAGEAGAVVTNNKDVFEKIRIMRDVGQSKKYYHTMFGYNSRLDTIQAAVLSVKLKKLNAWNKKRREIAKVYRKLLIGLPIILPPEMVSGNIFNYHLFPIRTEKRDQLLKYLKENGVYCGIHYPVPLHLQKALAGLGYKKGDFPIAEKYAKELLSLPIFAEMHKKEVYKVSKLIHDFFSNKK